MAYLFVYGSLKRGFKQHDRHMKRARFVAETMTKEPAFKLVAVLDPDTDPPYAGILDGGAFHVKGELYEVEDKLIARLNTYEGENYTLKEIALANGSTAGVYFFTKADIPTTETYPRIRHSQTPAPTAEWLAQA